MREFSIDERFAAEQLARTDLYCFTRWMFYQRRKYLWQRSPHHKKVCDALMRVYRGETKRLIINIPPRYSKTEIAVVNFIAWALGHVPDAEFIHASYSSTLAVNNSANVYSLVQNEAYQRIFSGVQLATDAKAHWTTTAGGVMYATGAGGTITGFGAGKHRPGFGGAIIIDDPHKADEANSDVIRGGVLDWFQNTLESRKNSKETPIIVIMQRLHEEDLSGWLLDGGNGEKWDHICLSAVQEDGTALWPDKHSIEDLRRMERAAPYVFAGQYRQSPAPPDGGVIKPGNIEIVDAIPSGTIRWCRGWDFAASVKKEADFTAGAKIGRLQDGRFIIADIVRGQLGPDERDKTVKNTATADGKPVKVSIPQDPGQAGKTQALYLTRELAGFNVKTSPESGDKVTRASPFAAQINVGNVLMLRGSWNRELTDEMKLFPNGKHDDQVDACSRAFAELIDHGKTGLIEFYRQEIERRDAALNGN